MWEFLRWLGSVSAIVALAGATAWGLFRVFAERWLSSKFDERLERLKHAQEQEVENLRGRISALLDRTTKLHQREYEALPLLWEKMASADAELRAFISPFQRVTDIARMDGAQLEEFLKDADLQKTQKAKLRAAQPMDRTNIYAKERYWPRKAKVDTALREFSRYLKFQGVFVLPAIKEKSRTIERLLWDAYSEYTVSEENDIRPRQRQKEELLETEGQKTLDEIEALIQERLWTVTEL